MLRHPDRVLRLEGASNFRDLGGYPGREGRPVRWRQVFRSDHLAGLTESDHRTLATLELAKALDFRGVGERAATPFRLPGVTQHWLPIEPTVALRTQEMIARGEPVTSAVMTRLMRDLYRGFVNDQATRYAEFFDHLLHADSPLVFHCTAGKDRTGFAAALLLLALGVPRDLVMQDYLLSNELFRHPPIAADNPLADALRVVWRVDAGFLAAALDAIDADHGGIDRYLQQRLGLTQAALHTLADAYLEPA